MRHKHRHGFTIIELLVIVSIVALLIALLLPGLGMARKAVQRTTCAARIRQIGMMGTTYQADWVFPLSFRMTDFYNTVVAGGIEPWRYGWSWAGQLIEGRYYTRRNEMLHETHPVSSTNAYWQELRRNSVLLCPSGNYFPRATTTQQWGAWSQRVWPMGVGAYHNDPAAVDIVDYHNYHTPYPDWAIPQWGAPTAGRHFALIMSSYNVNGQPPSSTARPNEGLNRTETINGITGYVPIRQRSNAPPPSKTVAVFEANESTARRELDMDTETPFSPTVTAPNSNRTFRIPHLDTANFAAMDGHVGVALRKHFGLTNKSERPFVW